MSVSAELRFSPEVKPYRLNPRHNPPNFAVEALQLFADYGFEPSFQPLIGVLERIRVEGVSIAPIAINQLDTSEFLLAPVQEVSMLAQGGTLQAVKIIYRSAETNSYVVEQMIPTRRAREEVVEPDPLRPTLEIRLVSAVIQSDRTVQHQEQEFPRIDVFREYAQPRHPLFENVYTLSTVDQSGESHILVQSSHSPKDAEAVRHIDWLIASAEQMIHRHEELQQALARGEVGLSDKTGEEVMEEENQQIIVALQAAAAQVTEGKQSLVPVDQMLASLTSREQEIIRLRYGIGIHDGIQLSKAEVARQLGISSPAVAQHEEKALRKLRKKFKT